jgi:LysR family glycine cleavage system transcriptional activator
VEALTDIQALESAANTVTVACTMGFATYWLMPRLEAFYRDHPDIVVNVQTIPHEVPALGPGTDIAMRYGDGSWTDGTVHLLFEERVEPVCAPGLAARISEGRREPGVRVSDPCRGGRQALDFLAAIFFSGRVKRPMDLRRD